MKFEPNFQNIVDAAQNRVAKRLPLYEHGIDLGVMETVLGVRFAHLRTGTLQEKNVFFKNYCDFFKKMGYDTVSFEACIGSAMPGAGALGGHRKGVIQTRDDFEKYPWDTIEDNFFRMYGVDFETLRENLPTGMKAIGGAGYGIFECVQDLVGYMDLCYLREDDETLYADLFQQVGKINLGIWKRLLKEYGDVYCVCRFGDDLGFKSTTLLPPQDICALIVPQYAKIIAEVHRAGKPFLLHSCGCIFNVMDALLAAGIDAKHSNEDQIAPFSTWVERYGDRIGNFGGIDTDAVCRLTEKEMQAYIENVVESAAGHGGFAFGSGNSIPEYVPVRQYLKMMEIVRRLRGENIESFQSCL